MAYTVLVTRPLEQAREFAAEIENNGFHAVIQPLLKIENISLSIQDIDRPHAILLTSLHGFGHMKFSDWLDIPVFTVGLKTKEVAGKLGFIKIYSGASDINDIFPIIQKNIPTKSKILYLRGEDIKQNIHQKLSDYIIQEKITYSAKATEHIDAHILKHFKNIDVLTLFSARSGQILKSLLQKHGLISSLCTIKLLCLSHAVLESVEDLNWKSCHVADCPTTSSMIETLESIRHE